MIATASSPTASSTARSGGRARSLKLAIALAWLIGLATTNAWLPPIVLAAVAAVVAALTLGRVPAGTLASAVAPLWLVALGIGSSTRCSGPRTPIPPRRRSSCSARGTHAEALQAGVGLGAAGRRDRRVGAVFALTTDSTRLADALVQQARVPERFAYGALAAYGAIPRFGADLANAARQARRIRGLRGSWHPRLLVGLLVLAIRHGDRLALAMDARGVRLRAADALSRELVRSGSTPRSASVPRRHSSSRCCSADRASPSLRDDGSPCGTLEPTSATGLLPGAQCTSTIPSQTVTDRRP